MTLTRGSQTALRKLATRRLGEQHLIACDPETVIDLLDAIEEERDRRHMEVARFLADIGGLRASLADAEAELRAIRYGPAADWHEAVQDLSDAERIIRLCQRNLEWAMDAMERDGRTWLPADMIVAVQDARAFLGLPRAVPRDQETDGSLR